MSSASLSRSPALDAHSQAMDAAVVRMRAALERTRSERLLALFDYLVAQADEPTAPSESQIAAAVFIDARSPAYRPDANVRVYIHRLRKLIEAEFAARDGPFLRLPAGTYRLELAGEVGEPDETPAENSPVDSRPPARAKRAAWLLLLLAVIMGAGTLVWWQHDRGNTLATISPWSALAGSNRPVTVVMGDYYFFTETPPSAPAEQPLREVWDHSVPTREDLIIFQMLNPQKAETVTDMDQHYVTAATMTAAATIRAALMRDEAFRDRAIRLIAASQLTPDVLKVSDIIYIGQMGGIGTLLRDPLTQASRFRLDAGLNGLVDTVDGKRYQSDGMELHDERIARRDYGYLACLPGPAGNTVLFIASLHDPGLSEMAELSTDAGRMRSVAHGRIGCGGGFEALFQVRTLGSAHLGSTWLLDRPAKVQGIWDNSAPAPEYWLNEAASAP
ncbi:MULTISPECIES: helix-turn-helix domain-containing protein [unclassified Novosphingobium]|uniref:helix-turn-helix domain-containing protein n=1 Tax=unclassified Novosphingobium TaxID=2644732 RepID=UPI000869C53B|nr:MULTISPECIES: helix-turn-helix domain-containing protein [unclassified Novosphingobium]MDR6707571.1 hypothetical protein [Novosphingobium sp. 1748]ODU79067.1 MAG: hypothetical protein ABT10_21435 [Novosphingobium sp. SCN 63-17]OJX96261.1 MAG: hypothetical protein BGP00_16830 [Novosphingobium sp. 63-713]